jgi:hypothetical protein
MPAPSSRLSARPHDPEPRRPRQPARPTAATAPRPPHRHRRVRELPPVSLVQRWLDLSA